MRKTAPLPSNRAATIRVISGGVIAVSLVGAGVTWLLQRDQDARTWRYWQKRLPQTLAEARAAGIATSVEEAKEPAPRGLNGAPLLETEFAALKLMKLESHYTWRTMYKKGGKDRLIVLAEIKRFSPQLPGILAAGQADFLQWSVDPIQSYEGISHAGQVMNSATRAASIMALEGDAQHVRAVFHANRNVRQNLSTYGTDGSLSAATYMRLQAAQSLVGLAANPNVDPNLVQDLARTLDDPPLSLKRAVRLEAFARQSYFESGRDSDWMQPDLDLKEVVDPPYFIEWKSYYRAPESALREGYFAWMLHAWTNQWQKGDRSILDVARSAPAYSFPQPLHTQRAYPLDYFTDSSLEQIAAFWIQRKASADACIAAALVHLYQRRHGEWPQSLAQISSVPPDPWTGKPFWYQKHPDRFYIWSVGHNGKNDWGKGHFGPAKGDDICFYSQTGDVER